MRRTTLLSAIAVLLGAGCASRPDEAARQAEFRTMLERSFRAEGIAGLDRLQQDAGQAACSTGEPLSAEQLRQIQAEAQSTLRPPTDGRYLGDWREGEKLAQSGRGMTWTDRSAASGANGGSCYNCHQIDAAELSHGTIGPSLSGYGRLRGVTDPASPQAAAVLQYTWGKLQNSWAYQACSNMPRFGHKGLLDEQQMRHLMALLLDPASPVNRP